MKRILAAVVSKIEQLGGGNRDKKNDAFAVM